MLLTQSSRACKEENNDLYNSTVLTITAWAKQLSASNPGHNTLL